LPLTRKTNDYQNNEKQGLKAMSEKDNKDLENMAAQGVGYAMALRRVIAWLKSGKTLEEFFDIHKAEYNLIWEWTELRDEINKLKKRK
jgi:hypothetical protein